MKSKLQGIMGAPVTPFDADNRVDFETFEKQIHFLIEAGGTSSPTRCTSANPSI